MERHASFLLPVWQEVCRHIELEDSLARLAPVLRRRLAIDELAVRHFDAAKGICETVSLNAGEPLATPARARVEVSSVEMQGALSWCRGGNVQRGTSARLRKRWQGLIPAQFKGHVLIGPLQCGEQDAGALILAARNPDAFDEEHESLALSLLEPFSVALQNDHRVRELIALREAVEADNRSLLSRLDRHDISDSIVGAETGLKPVMEQINLVARSDAPVLVLGETGSGKEVVARAIHTRSARSSGPFLRVNCGAIPPELIDSELFGHERGSFTGAVGDRKGWFERADGGTLFLDECGELPPAAQVRLLRILQDGTFERVGGEQSQSVDVRIVAATHRDLATMVGAGRFRQDLLYRLAVFPIRLPPLRERPSDIAALAAHFALRAAKRLGLQPLVPSARDVGMLVGYPWPGNVRELAAVIERAAILGSGVRLEIERALGAGMTARAHQEMQSTPGAAPNAVAGVATLDAAIRAHIELALDRTAGRIEGRKGAAALLKINPHTLRARMRKLGIDWTKFREAEANG